MFKSLTLKGEQKTEELGKQLASLSVAPILIFLEGELGAGKTTLVRGFLRALGYQGAVKSPTYTLVEEYKLTTGPLYHFDLYRLRDPEELDFIGIRDYFSEKAIVLIEWAEKGQGFLPTADLLLNFSLNDQNTREVLLQSFTKRGETVVSNIHEN